MRARRYTVVWNDDVTNDYATMWTDADSDMRSDMTDVAALFDSNLSQRPAECGVRSTVVPQIRIYEVVRGGHRFSCFYQVIEDDCLVRVMKIAVTEELE